MAIDPSTKYAGQVSVADPTGYPFGKAQDEAVAGDGTGTPLESDWVSDLWGWQQAILAAGGVTPSGTPDKVGASEYLNALNARSPTWSGNHTFNNSLKAAGSAEYLYSGGGRTRTFLLPLELGVPNAPSATYTDAHGWAFTDPANYVYVPLELPSGTRIDGIQFGYENQGTANTVVVRLQRVTPNTAGGASTLGTAIDISGSGTAIGAAGNLALTAVVDNSASRLRITIMAGTGDGAAQRGKCNWIKMTVLDLGPRNL